MATPAPNGDTPPPPPPPDGTPPPPNGTHHDEHHHRGFYPFFGCPYCVQQVEQQPQQKTEPTPAEENPPFNWIPVIIAALIGGVIGYAIAKR